MNEDQCWPRSLIPIPDNSLWERDLAIRMQGSNHAFFISFYEFEYIFMLARGERKSQEGIAVKDPLSDPITTHL
jgi:hypothetical protein